MEHSGGTPAKECSCKQHSGCRNGVAKKAFYSLPTGDFDANGEDCDIAFYPQD